MEEWRWRRISLTIAVNPVVMRRIDNTLQTLCVSRSLSSDLKYLFAAASPQGHSTTARPRTRFSYTIACLTRQHARFHLATSPIAPDLLSTLEAHQTWHPRSEPFLPLHLAPMSQAGGNLAQMCKSLHPQDRVQHTTHFKAHHNSPSTSNLHHSPWTATCSRSLPVVYPRRIS